MENNRNVSIINNDKCTGCGACHNICPTHAIVMQRDSRGFLTPQTSTECIMCGRCVAVCPANTEKEKEDTVKNGYAVKNLNMCERYSSSSGGAFPIIAHHVLNLKGSVYGAAFDKNYQVQHIRAVTHTDVNRIKGSKYVQSDISAIYPLIEHDLKNDMWVLFSGTPCQCAGIRKYLLQKLITIEKLILVDIICHGVPSPLIWKLYVQWQKEKYGDIYGICFRDKRFGSEHYALCVKHENYDYCKKDMQDPYIHIFCKDLAIRDSCKDCFYKKRNRNTDITIGDFPNAERKLGALYDDKGISLVMINSQKGKQIFDLICTKFEAVPLDMRTYTQSNLAPAKIIVKNSQKFWKDLEQRGFSFVLKHYTEEGVALRTWGNLKRTVRKLITKMQGT